MQDIIALPSFVFGYHGCDQSVAEKVLAGEEQLKPSQNDYDWLETGIYFWEHNPRRAFEWAQEIKRRGGSVKHPCALGAIIDLGNCLNLLDADGLKIAQSGYAMLHEMMTHLGKSLPHNKNKLLRNLDCAVINLIHEIHGEKGKVFEGFDTVRAVFVEGEPLYPEAGFHEKNHIQLCVRNQAAIKAYFNIFNRSNCKMLTASGKSAVPCDACG
jgi:hypothetical protein